MKKYLILTLLMALLSVSYSQPKISNLSYHSTAVLFELYETAFNLGTYSNPYDPEVINVYAEFFAPDGKKFTVNGFYYEEYILFKYNGYEKSKPNPQKNGWRIRFTPTQVGTWRFVIHAIDRKGETICESVGTSKLTFSCRGVTFGKGFISKANSDYLKRDVMICGKRQNHSFFPTGPNVAWYDCKSYYDYNTPKGIYFYEKFIDSLSGKANYMRVWMSRYEYLSLYGPEYTQMSATEKTPTIYFNSTINQKDAAEFDQIVDYAAQKGITLMPCLFTFGDFRYKGTDDGPSKWTNNPFHTVLRLKQPHEFFSNAEARRITRNLIRYIVARWGYATNIVAWELWNEVTNMDFDNQTSEQYGNKIIAWHKEMAELIRNNDPFNHLISTSIGGSNPDPSFITNLFSTLDFVQLHQYFNIDKARSKDQVSYKLHLKSLSNNDLHPSKPFFIGEFGFGDQNVNGYLSKDPFGVDLHNTLWASLFSNMMGPASFWLWYAIDKCNIYPIFKPIMTFCETMPIPSSTFKAYTTGEAKKSALVFPNNLETYYMMNAAEDTLYGWSQDTAFCYQSLRHLTQKGVKNGHFEENATVDKNGYLYTLKSNKKPRPSSRRNTIILPLTQQAEGTEYILRWYDTETGLEMRTEAATVTVKKSRNKPYLSIEFPSSIRDVRNSVINNTFGDAVFMLTKKQKANNTTQKKSSIKMKGF